MWLSIKYSWCCLERLTGASVLVIRLPSSHLLLTSIFDNQIFFLMSNVAFIWGCVYQVHKKSLNERPCLVVFTTT